MESNADQSCLPIASKSNGPSSRESKKVKSSMFRGLPNVGVLIIELGTSIDDIWALTGAAFHVRSKGGPCNVGTGVGHEGQSEWMWGAEDVWIFSHGQWLNEGVVHEVWGS